MLPIPHRRFTLAIISLSFFGVLPVISQTLIQDHKLTASDRTRSDLFGYRIDIDNGIVAVGAIGNDDNGNESGSAYLFDASTGEQLFKLLPSDGMANDHFGSSIAIDNGVVAVGAESDDDNGNNSGSVYLFDASTGAQLFKLLPIDGKTNDFFGRSIDISNGIVTAGASGSAYVFDASSGEQLAKILPNDGEMDDLFGLSIAIDNGIVVVGARDENELGVNSGSAYLFNASTGVQISKLLPSDGRADDWFGRSIAIADGIVAVGADLGGGNGFNSGSAYLFDASNGVQIAKLLPSDGAEGDLFGRSIAIADGIVAVGADLDDDNGFNSGSAYLFDAFTGLQIAKLLPSDGTKGDRFARFIAIADGVVVAGAHRDIRNAGSAYVLSVDGPCIRMPADLTGDGILDFFDISVFLEGFGNLDPIADFTGDGILDFFDLSELLQAFAQGCS